MKGRLTYGADPELFIRVRGFGTVPICGLIGGSKSKPLDVSGFGLQEDNVMAEYTVPVSYSSSDMIVYSDEGRATLLRWLTNKHNMPYDIVKDHAQNMSHDMLERAGPGAREFGCSPDFDAYKQGEPYRRISPEVLMNPTGQWRFAGGHIHIGYKELHPNVPAWVVAMFMDATVGLHLVQYDRQPQRRQWYGQAGRHRPTPYGVEYRVPSNRWLYQGETRTMLQRGLSYFERLMYMGDADLLRLYETLPWREVQQAINMEDAMLASNILTDNRTLMQRGDDEDFSTADLVRTRPTLRQRGVDMNTMVIQDEQFQAQEASNG